MNDMHRIRRETRRRLRERIDGAKAIDALEQINTEIDARRSEMTAVELGALKLKAEIARNMLHKVLPDLKSVEHEIGENLADLAEAELESRLAELLGKAGVDHAALRAFPTH